ncbi:MAG TPA: GWxTD domain-containing protein [Gemmatimonadales bacterium]|nr:GWxTD domain-containing protein [Gemmatimonadales bacterium]
MRKVKAALASAGLLLAAPAPGAQGGDQPLTVSAVRFYSPASATTTIEGVCEVSLGAVAPGAAQMARYRIEIQVNDSSGLELQRDGWDREVPAAVARAPRATAVETFGFRAAPGRYRVLVRAIPAGGRAFERAMDVSAFAARPPLSDLLVATSVRTASDTVAAAAGEIQRAGLLLRTAPMPQLSPAEASLSYYAEVYPWPGAPLEGRLSVAILGPGRRSIVRTAPAAVRFAAEGGVTKGSLDVTGLPPGPYVLQLQVSLGDSTVEREAPFVMGVEREAPSVPVVETGDRFDASTEAGLDSMYAPLVYLLEAGEQGVYEQLSVDGKRRFLREFWAKRDPTHGAGANTVMDQFYGLVGFANETFREGGAAQIPGWRTDRGRVFLRNGRWDEILRRPMASPLPYEVWKYTRGRQRYYVFVDQSGLGHYQLIGTSDRQEQGLPNWPQLLGSENYTDVARFLGITTLEVPQ